MGGYLHNWYQGGSKEEDMAWYLISKGSSRRGISSCQIASNLFSAARLFPALIDCYPWPFCKGERLHRTLYYKALYLTARLRTVCPFVNYLHLCAHGTLHCTALRLNAQDRPRLASTYCNLFTDFSNLCCFHDLNSSIFVNWAWHSIELTVWQFQWNWFELNCCAR